MIFQSFKNWPSVLRLTAVWRNMQQGRIELTHLSFTDKRWNININFILTYATCVTFFNLLNVIDTLNNDSDALMFWELKLLVYTKP